MESYNKDYSLYSVEDFVADEFFQNWVLSPGSESQVFWEKWLNQHPEKRKLIEEAKQLILALGFSNQKVSEDRVNRVRQIVEQHIHSQTISPKIRKLQVQKTISPYRNLYWVAASLTGLLILSMLAYFLLQTNEQSYQTAYGETKQITLPDGSQVTLNANSKLSFKNSAQEREVWLEGDALFEVNKMVINPKSSTYKPFIVHAKHLQIKVLGTEFNVKSRPSQTNVVLHSGKVQLYLNDSPKKTTYVMQPGEQAVYAQSRAELKLNRLNTEKLTAWKQNKLIFDEVALQEVAQILKENYGLEVVFKKPDLAQKKFVGSIPSNNVDMLFVALSKLYGIEVQKKGKQIILSSSND